MAAREVFSFTSSRGDISILENSRTKEIGFQTKKAPLGGGAKRGVGIVWLPASLVLGFVDSLQSLEVVVDAAGEAVTETSEEA